jgi:Tfp pilus assembly protein PilV
MNPPSADDGYLHQILTGAKRKVSTLREGWNTWEFLVLLLALALLLYISIFYTFPLFTEEQNYTPDQQSYQYIEINSQISNSNGDLNLLCTPSSSYASTDSSFTCEFMFYNTTEGELTRFSEEEVNEIMGTIIWYSWIDQGAEGDKVAPGSNVIRSDHAHNKGDYYTVHGEFLISTPESAGRYDLSIRFGGGSEDQYSMRDDIYVYSDAQIAAFQHRETIGPLEELVTVGLSLAIFRLILELSQRIHRKVENRR